MAKKSKAKKVWMFAPAKALKAKVTEEIKRQVEETTNKLLDEWKTKYIQPPSKDHQFNYIVDLYSTWYRCYLYFCAKYACPSPMAIAPFFEARYSRLEYIGEDRFNLAFMRHTGQWIETHRGLTLDECIEAMKLDPFYHPS